MSFEDLLDQVQQTVADTLAWPDTPVDAVIDAIGPVRDASRTPLFQVIFTFHDSVVPDLSFCGLTGAVTERENGAAMCDLTVMVVPRAAQRLGREPRPEDDDLTLVWEYSTDLFDETTMTRMAAHYLNLLTGALAAPSTPVGDLRLLGDAELARLGSWSRGPTAAGATRPARRSRRGSPPRSPRTRTRPHWSAAAPRSATRSSTGAAMHWPGCCAAAA